MVRPVRIHVVLLFLLASVLACFAVVGCKGPGGDFASPIVATFDGKLDGTMRTNGRWLFCRGAVDATTGVRSVYGGLPLTEPVARTADQWFLVDLWSFKVTRGELGVAPLIPSFVRSMFAPDEIAPIDGWFEPLPAPPVDEPPQVEPASTP